MMTAQVRLDLIFAFVVIVWEKLGLLLLRHICVFHVHVCALSLIVRANWFILSAYRTSGGCFP